MLGINIDKEIHWYYIRDDGEAIMRKRNVFKRIWEAITINNDYDLMREINRRRGSVKSEAKTRAVRENGKKGGRPKGSKNKPKGVSVDSKGKQE